MKWRRWLGLFSASLFVFVAVVNAQGGSGNVAFVNSSGQLVVASGDGSTRWIVTNPGETLARPLGFTWSPDGRRVFFALSAGGGVSLRVGDVGSQSVSEIGQASGSVSGGDWTPDGSGILIAANNSLSLYPVNGSGAQSLGQLNGNITLVSPFANDRPNIPAAHSISPDGSAIFLWQSDASQGNYVVFGLNSGNAFALGVLNDANARQSGLWSDDGSLVAYWGYDASGNSVLAVTDADNGQTVTLNSGRTTPISPLGWRSGTQQLVYRDTTNFVRIADLSCVSGGCGSNPLESGIELLAAGASDIQPARDWVYFRENEQIKAVSLSCVSGNTCANNAVILAESAAPRTWMHVGGNLLAYTAYTQDPNNTNDREARVINLGCVSNPSSCQATAVAVQSVSGLVSPSGAYITIDQVGNGLNAVNTSNLQFSALSGSLGGQLGTGLESVRWE